MPRPEKGSQAAKEWAAKMKKAREAKKKSIQGGVIDDDTRVIMDVVQSHKKQKTDEKELNRTKRLDAYDIRRMDSAIRRFRDRYMSHVPQERKQEVSDLLMSRLYSISQEDNQLLDNANSITDDQHEPTGGAGIGGKISMKSIQRGFTKVGSQLSKAVSKINPMAQAIENKGTREALVQSGDVTQNYLLPAVTTAGLPLYYGAAGTAGMLVGGPVGSMAATKAADELFQGMVVKRGYDPRARQKSKTLDVVSKKSGELGAKNLKQGASGKGMRKKKQEC